MNQMDLWEKKLELQRLTEKAYKLRAEITAAEQAKARSRITRLSSNKRDVLEALYNWPGSTDPLDRRYITQATILGEIKWPMRRAALRQALTLLQGLGLVELRKGLFTEDGQPFGSGYAITDEGVSWWETVETRTRAAA